MTGVYRISNILDCQEYIGSTTQGFRRRWNQHLRELRAGKHHSWLLQKAWNAYGELFFTFDILEECLPVKCIAREQWWINNLNPEYNICPIAGAPMTGRKATKNTIEKMRIAHLGLRHTPEARMNMSIAQRGHRNYFARKHTLASRALMSASLIGNKIWLGRKHTPESKAKMSLGKLGWKGPLGHKQTPEHISKRSIAMKLSWSNRRSVDISNPIS
jgi:group I intron endonuclease